MQILSCKVATDIVVIPAHRFSRQQHLYQKMPALPREMSFKVVIRGYNQAFLMRLMKQLSLINSVFPDP